jgi:hypothetical protein
MHKISLKVLKRDMLPNSTWTSQLYIMSSNCDVVLYFWLVSRLLFDSGIQQIEEGAFDGLKNISYLYLQQNNFTRLPKGVFKNFNPLNLKVLVLTCDFEVLPAIKPSISSFTRCPLSSEGISITAQFDLVKNLSSCVHDHAPDAASWKTQ